MDSAAITPAAQPTEAEGELKAALSELNALGAKYQDNEYTDTEEFWRIADELNNAATRVLQERGVPVQEPKVNRA